MILLSKNAGKTVNEPEESNLKIVNKRPGKTILGKL